MFLFDFCVFLTVKSTILAFILSSEHTGTESATTKRNLFAECYNLFCPIEATCSLKRVYSCAGLPMPTTGVPEMETTTNIVKRCLELHCVSGFMTNCTMTDFMECLKGDNSDITTVSTTKEAETTVPTTENTEKTVATTTYWYLGCAQLYCQNIFSCNMSLYLECLGATTADVTTIKATTPLKVTSGVSATSTMTPVTTEKTTLQTTLQHTSANTTATTKKVVTSMTTKHSANATTKAAVLAPSTTASGDTSTKTTIYGTTAKSTTIPMKTTAKLVHETTKQGTTMMLPETLEAVTVPGPTTLKDNDATADCGTTVTLLTVPPEMLTKPSTAPIPDTTEADFEVTKGSLTLVTKAESNATKEMSSMTSPQSIEKSTTLESTTKLAQSDETTKTFEATTLPTTLESLSEGVPSDSSSEVTSNESYLSTVQKETTVPMSTDNMGLGTLSSSSASDETTETARPTTTDLTNTTETVTFPISNETGYDSTSDATTMSATTEGSYTWNNNSNNMTSDNVFPSTSFTSPLPTATSTENMLPTSEVSTSTSLETSTSTTLTSSQKLTTTDFIAMSTKTTAMEASSTLPTQTETVITSKTDSSLPSTATTQTSESTEPDETSTLTTKLNTLSTIAETERSGTNTPMTRVTTDETVSTTETSLPTTDFETTTTTTEQKTTTIAPADVEISTLYTSDYKNTECTVYGSTLRTTEPTTEPTEKPSTTHETETTVSSDYTTWSPANIEISTLYTGDYQNTECTAYGTTLRESEPTTEQTEKPSTMSATETTRSFDTTVAPADIVISTLYTSGYQSTECTAYGSTLEKTTKQTEEFSTMHATESTVSDTTSSPADIKISATYHGETTTVPSYTGGYQYTECTAYGSTLNALELTTEPTKKSSTTHETETETSDETTSSPATSTTTVEFGNGIVTTTHATTSTHVPTTVLSTLKTTTTKTTTPMTSTVPNPNQNLVTSTTLKNESLASTAKTTKKSTVKSTTQTLPSTVTSKRFETVAVTSKASTVAKSTEKVISTLTTRPQKIQTTTSTTTTITKTLATTPTVIKPTTVKELLTTTQKIQETTTTPCKCSNAGTCDENGSCVCADGYFGDNCDSNVPSAGIAAATTAATIMLAASQSSSGQAKYIWPRYSATSRMPTNPHDFFRLLSTYWLTVALGVNSMFGVPASMDIKNLPKCSMAYLFGTGAFFFSLTAMIFEAGVDALTLSGAMMNAWNRRAERRPRCFPFWTTFTVYCLVGVAPIAIMWLRHWTDCVTPRSCIGSLGYIYGGYDAGIQNASWLQLTMTIGYAAVALFLAILAILCNKFDVCRCRRRTEAWSINPYIYGREIWPLEVNAYLWLIAIQPVLFMLCWISYIYVNDMKTRQAQLINLIITGIYGVTSCIQSALTTSQQLSNTLEFLMTAIPENYLRYMPSMNHVTLNDKVDIVKSHLRNEDWKKIQPKYETNDRKSARFDRIPFGLEEYMYRLWLLDYIRIRDSGFSPEESLTIMGRKLLQQRYDLRIISTFEFAQLFGIWAEYVKERDSGNLSSGEIKKSRQMLDREMDLKQTPPKVVINECGNVVTYRKKMPHLAPIYDKGFGWNEDTELSAEKNVNAQQPENNPTIVPRNLVNVYKRDFNVI